MQVHHGLKEFLNFSKLYILERAVLLLVYNYRKLNCYHWLMHENLQNQLMLVLYFLYQMFKLKGNAQFIFLSNPQKSGASRVCITFPQITKKILTKDIFHCLELITEILSLLQIFSVRKTTTQLF